MNWEQIEGKWKQLKGSVKTKWGKLTDSDLDVIAGKRDLLIGKVQERYGIATELAEKQVSEWIPAFDSQPAMHQRSKHRAG
ncbi:MAG TPA: CsbD family protein [Candidatus Angelobacter sp.]|nr:CsbD family protein [Candidatus Angelobacter sp.]